MSLPDRAPFTDMSVFLKAIQWPVMPEVGQALIRTLNDEEADMFTVCRIIGKDPALTATLLRMANSAMFGLSGTVDTLERAVSVVGMSLVRARALSVCVVHSCQLPLGIDRKEFWRYSMLCAGYAQWLAELCDVDDQEAWLCGMMLRLGEINLGQARPLALPSIEAKPILPGERWLRQRQLVGFDEGEVTAELLLHWDFPMALVEGLRHAAQPLLGSEFRKLSAVLNLAARLAETGPVTLDALTELPVILLQMLHLDPQTLLLDAPDADTLADVSAISV
ncbi:HDOD domain-containing protein [Rhodoferax sp.]|uniref:HDOD domain-containing protein n=1 Tax=Rhodoferax sp. TaxID=50421 RepID=UPI0026245908|nr:HDOD domain-containing protein [Rhodoferax sp.]MDD2810573.1 HDOD domain-containing protein [Rhodoferax sp.]MDD4945067.1 HDOD domain-containing protein [Rhodoferax sp.]MDD5480926.1 HDOD domain-containing protein [Rhodoferax sp.]